MQLKTPSTISDESQILNCRMVAVIQQRCIFDQQIFSRLAAALARTFQVGCQDALKANCSLTKEAIGRFEFGPLRESLRQGSARTGGQMLSDVH
jgi:hypothetical protein